MIGPAAAGLLTVSIGGGWAIAADAASFFLAAVCFGRISLPGRPPRAAGSSTMLSELREGWSYFSSQPWIWSVTLAFAVLNAVYMGIWQILGPVIAVDTIGAEGWGLVLSARAAGSLLATMVMVKLTVRRPMVRALSLMTLAAAPLILLGVGANALWLAAAAFASIPLGQLSVPFLAAAFGAAAVAITGGALLAAAMLLPLLLPSLRRIEMNTVARGVADSG
jgi:hypothetical protein